MRVQRVSKHIWSLRWWFLIPIHVWVVADDDGVTLVDAGLPYMAGGILRFIEELDAGPLQRILLTHGHGDHVGAVRRVRERFPVPVLAHRVEIPYLEGDLPYPRRRRPEPALPKGLVQALAEEADGALTAVAGLRPYHSPGHSPGHVVYYHEQDRVLVAGDLLTSSRGRLRPPMAMFTGDMVEALRSASIVRRLGPEQVLVCHGGPVGPDGVREVPW